MTEFAMVEELAFLVKDNLPCKHLVLSVEEALVNFLQSDNSSDGFLELEPMNSYNRLLLHRLADIFGFIHQSVGEGEDRHLILERCPETSIPPILVSDILWQHEVPLSPTRSHIILKRIEVSPVSEVKSPSVQQSLEEREAAYLAARERIFSVNLGEVKEPVKQKPRGVPVVARRMIAHALGQKMTSTDQVTTHNDFGGSGGKHESNIQNKDTTQPHSIVEALQESLSLSDKSINTHNKVKKSSPNIRASSPRENMTSQKQAGKVSSSVSGSQSRRDRNGVKEDYYKREHMGAAKRLFSHALGMQSGKDGFLSKCSETNHNNAE